MDKNEKYIIVNLKKGDEQAYKFIYDTYYTYLCKIAFEFVQDRYTAKTIVNDTIFHLWEKRSNLEIQSLKPYLVQAVRNHCLNFLKKERLTENYPDDNLNACCKTDLLPISELIGKELNNQIESLLNELPEQSRKVFCLSRFESKKYEEIAQIMGISVNTVKYHIKMALALFKLGLKDYLLLVAFLFLLFKR